MSGAASNTFSPKFKLLAKNSVGGAVYTTPVAASDTLYVSACTPGVAHLIAIKPRPPR